MLEARSVAVVGASVKEGSLGQQMLLELARGGYEGDVYPVNPGYDEVGGSAVTLDRRRARSRRPRDPRRGERAGGAGAARRRRRRRERRTFSSLFEEEPPEAGVPPWASAVGDRSRARDGDARRQRDGVREPRPQALRHRVPDAGRPRAGRRHAARTPARSSRRSCSTTAGTASTCSCRAGRRSSRRWTSTSPTRSTCRRRRSWAPARDGPTARGFRRGAGEGRGAGDPGVRVEGRTDRG